MLESPKQYKIRFKQWGFWKNLSTQNANSLLQMKESRDSLGKISTFRRSGQAIDINRIEKTIRRSKSKALNEASTESFDARSARLSLHVPALPTGIECRTPSPEPKLEADLQAPADTPIFDADEALNFDLISPLDASDQFKMSSLGASGIAGGLLGSDLYSPDFVRDFPDHLNVSSSIDHHRYDSHMDRLERCYHITQKKLISASARLLPSLTHPDPEIQSFRSRNALLAILESIIGNKSLVTDLFLRNFAAAFRHHQEFSLFIQEHVIPSLGESQPNQTCSPFTETVENAIANALLPLNLFALTRKLIDTRGIQNEARSDQAFWSDATEFIVPSALSPSADSSISEVEMPPTPSDDAPHTFDDYHLVNQLETAASAHHSGHSTLAKTLFHAITAYENVTTMKGKVLTRLAWYCLSCLYRQSGTAAETQQCLMQAVRGSTYFCEDEGEDWHDVSHLFI